MTDLEKAMRRFAETYYNAHCRADWDEACDQAERTAKQLRYRNGNEPCSDDELVVHLRVAAFSYEDM